MKKLGILGPLGTFTEEAARKYNDGKSEIVPYDTITDVFRAVEGLEVTEGVVPLENFLNGHVVETLDNLYQRDVKIKKAIVLPIVHCLVSSENSEEIKEVLSHPQALAQCSEFLRRNYPGAEKVPVKSTAAAMKEVSESRKSYIAAIGSSPAARRYGLKVVEQNIGDIKDNLTMFAVISKESSERTGDDRTSIAVSPHHDRPGLLKDILNIFAEKQINLEMIQSRPDRKGSYIFYIDFAGHPDDENVAEAFHKLREIFGEDTGNFIKILGSYPHVSLAEEKKKQRV